jgi:hypothetical protein
VHRALFPQPPARKPLADLKEGIRRDVRRRHAKR